MPHWRRFNINPTECHPIIFGMQPTLHLSLNERFTRKSWEGQFNFTAHGMKSGSFLRYVVKIGLIGLMREKRGEELGGGEVLFDRYRFCGTIPRPTI